ncbi:hypothetical protein GNAINCEL_00035 [Serratia phage KKP 3709]|nr:hypothetical protein GNAINCEL_00035 [Serratia phage KKP 3709]
MKRLKSQSIRKRPTPVKQLKHKPLMLQKSQIRSLNQQETVEAGEQPQPGDAPTTVEEAPGGEGDALSQLIPQIKALLAELESVSAWRRHC